MNMFEEARALRTMMDMRGVTQGEMAKSLGVSQSYVANKLRLLKLDAAVQEEITRARISERHARAILRLNGSDKQLSAIKKIAERSLSVAETEALVDFWHGGKTEQKIGCADRANAVDAFTDGVTSGIRSLRALGINADEVRSYYGKKTYITICINEEKD